MSPAAKLQAWQELTPATRRAAIVSAALLALALGAVFLLLLPAKRESRRLATAVVAATADLDGRQAKIKQTSARRNEAEALEAELDALRQGGVLEPLLGSYEMRGMALLQPIAESNGVALVGGSVRRLPQLSLGGAPAQGRLYVRQPLEFTASGAYNQLAEFLRDVERAHPMATVSSLRIVAQARDPEVQEMTVGIEWPVVAPTTAPEKKGK